MVNRAHSTTLSIALLIVGLLAAIPAAAQTSAAPGATVRNAFGPQAGNKANQCRGACGAGCPSTCTKTVSYECLDAGQFRRVVAYDCGTHPGCRVHDDCLDACLQSSDDGANCANRCDEQVMERYGFESSFSWLDGGGPYDGRITFEYTQDEPDALEPTYQCPEGASRQCLGSVGCVAANGSRVAPVFAAYAQADTGSMRVSDFRAGPLCGDKVCEQSADIRVTGTDTCAGGRCTRFGMEFDYENADPSAPLECQPSTSGGDDDFIGGLLKKGADAMESRNANTAGNETAQGEDGMAELLGMFSKVIASADSPEDVNVSMAPLGEDGKPIESQRVGTTAGDGPPPIPRSIDLPAKSGHLFVPMYQLADGMPSGQVKERRIRCTHKGAPVLDTVFRLQAT